MKLPVADPVLVVAIVAAVIVAAPLLLDRYRIPGMIGILLGGAVLGPNGLGVLERGEAIVLLGTMGLLYIMFTAALEVDLAVLKRSRSHSAVFGLLTFAIPQGLGTVMGRYLFGMDWPAAVLLASLFASHTLLAYPIASRLGIAKSGPVTTAVGGTIFTDTAALMVLAVVAGSVEGDLGRGFWIRIGVSFTAYVLAVMLLLPRLARWFYRNVRPDGPSAFAFVLAVVFTVASLSQVAGLEPIIGAFLAGLALNRIIPHGSTLMNRITFTGDAFFIPFFLLSVGMLLDVRVFLAGPRSWYISLGMVGCVVVAKYLAAGLTRLAFGYTRAEGQVIFGLSVAQAAATLAAVMVGYRLNIFDEAVVNGAILMMLVTCTAAPWVVDRHGRTMARAQGEELAVGLGRAPQRIMVSLSNAETARPLVELALLLRDPAHGQPVYPLTVVRDGDEVMRDVAYAEQMLAKVLEDLTAADVPAQPVTRIDMHVAAAVRRSRKELRVTDVIMGWSGKPSAQARFFGSFLEHVLEERGHALWVSRLVHPLGSTARVFFVAPPNAPYEPGFFGTAAAVKRLSHQVGARLVVLAPAVDSPQAVRQLEKARPPLDVEPLRLESWPALVQRLAEEVSDRDLVVLYGARENSLSWSSAVSRLPRRLAGRFPTTNLVVVYPAEPEAEAEGAVLPAGAPAAPPMLRPQQVVLDVDNLMLPEAVATVLEEGAPRGAVEVTDQLVRDLAISAQELAPGVALLHANARSVRESLVLVGVSHSGIPLQRGQTATLLFLVVHPAQPDPQRHLNILAQVARLAHDPELPARARAARTADEVSEALAMATAAIDEQEWTGEAVRALPPATSEGQASASPDTRTAL